MLALCLVLLATYKCMSAWFKKAMYIQSLIHNYNIRKNTLMSQCGHDHIHIYKLSFTALQYIIIVLTLAPLETNNCTTAEC